MKIWNWLIGKRGPEPINMKSVAVVLIDMQKRFIKDLRKGDFKRIVPAQLGVLEYCNKFNIPVIVLEIEDVYFGKTIDLLMRQAKLNPSFRLVKKILNSGFYKTNLHSLLVEMGTTEILLMGINADCCVKDTAEDAIKNGYAVITSNDLIGGKPWHSLNNSSKWFARKCNYGPIAELAKMVQWK